MSLNVRHISENRTRSRNEKRRIGMYQRKKRIATSGFNGSGDALYIIPVLGSMSGV